MSIRKTWAVVKKETRHILRNPGSFALVTLSPLFILLTFAYSFSVDITNVAVAVVDLDRTSLSREFIAAAFSTADIRLAYYVNSTQDVEDLFLGDQAKAALIIPPGFM
ncbi:MAG: ABC transporter permease, partial [Chloroflexi bacterium]|nr:ABC transporter permease [Chloroflexota bacterium]